MVGFHCKVQLEPAPSTTVQPIRSQHLVGNRDQSNHTRGVPLGLVLFDLRFVLAVHTTHVALPDVEMEAVTYAFCWTAARRDSQTTQCHQPHRKLDTKMWKVKWEVETGVWQWVFDSHNLAMICRWKSHCPDYAESSQGKWRNTQTGGWCSRHIWLKGVSD